MRTALNRTVAALDCISLSRIAGLSVCLAGSFCGAPVVAQNTETPSASSTLEEIVVTSRRREERLHDVPVSVTAMNEAIMQDMGADRVQDLARAVPNFVFPAGSNNSRPDISVRGIFSNVRNMGFDVGLGVYLDGVFMGNRMSFDMDLADIERVEFLRGPQGTLFGKNTIAGAINIVSKLPDDELAGYVEAETGNRDLERVRAGLNLPLVDDKLAARLSAHAVSQDGYTRNLYDGSMLDDKGAAGGRLQLRYTPNEAWDINLSADYLDEDRTTSGSERMVGVYSDSIPYTVNSDHPENSDDRILRGAALSANYLFGGGYTLASITGWRDSQSHMEQDSDPTPLDIVNIDFRDSQEQWSQELRIHSPAGAGQRYDYVAGLYWFRQTASYVRLSPTGPTFLSMFGLPGIAGVTTNIGEVTTRSYAAFGNLNVHLTPKLTAFVGARYTDEDKSLVHAQDAGAFTFFGFPDFSNLRADNDATDTSWSVGLRFTPSDELMTYISAARGFKSGGFNADYITNFNSLTVGPEFVTNYEIGVKSAWLDHRLRANVAVFYQDYQDLQVTQFPPPPAVGWRFSNAAEATSQGVELELEARPMSALTLAAGVGYTDAHFDVFKRAEVNPVTGAPVDFDGRDLARAPEWTVNAAIQHQHELGLRGSLISRLDYAYVSSQFANANNSPESFLPSYGVYNARIRYQSPQEAWSVALWAENLTNERALVSSGNPWRGFGPMMDGLQVRHIAPRAYGLSVRYSF